MRFRMICLVFGALPFAGFVLCAMSPVHAGSHVIPHPNVPPTECEAHVGYDRDVDLPGYLIAKGHGPTQCVPITVSAAKPPKNYQGDFYVDEFTDAKLRARWAVCKADPVCYTRVNALITKRMPPNKEYYYTDPHAKFLLGKIDPKFGAALDKIRRPAFFSRAPYREGVANAEAHTFSVSFTAPRGPYERLVMNLHDKIHLRGWYMQGRGIDDGKGGKVRALIVMSNGGGGRLVSIEAPADRLYHMDPKTHKSVLNAYPNATTGSPGQRVWRELLYAFYQAGFDVLSYDRRGVGVSDGYTDTNTLQQGRDILQAIQSLKTGRGLAVLAPSGKRFAGNVAVKALMGDADPDTLPVILGGNSRGTMSSGWAMTQNFDKTCSYDLPVVKCGPPKKITNIKAAMMIAGFTAGAGYGVSRTSQSDQDRALFTAGMAVEHHVVFFPGSAVLAGVHKWPGLICVRGLWDYGASLEGTMDVYERVRGLREIAVVRGPHTLETWPVKERERVTQRMIVFARAAALGRKTAPGARSWSNAKELAATADPVWERSSQPASVKSGHHTSARP